MSPVRPLNRLGISDMDLLQFALTLSEEHQSGLLRFLNRTPAALAHWRKTRRLPTLVRNVLLLESGLRHFSGRPWDMQTFQTLRAATKAVEQVLMVYMAAHSASAPPSAVKKWNALRTTLDRVAKWQSNDWRKIFERDLDWLKLHRQMNREGRARYRRARQKGARPGRPRKLGDGAPRKASNGD